MREKFWEELNEARSKNEVKYWQGVFPEADTIDFPTVLAHNQWEARITNQDTVMTNYSSNMSNVQSNPTLKPFYTEFMNNYKVVDTESIYNANLFWSFSDRHHSIFMHRDPETVFLIQGYGEVAYAISNEDGSGNKLFHVKTGDALLLPRLTPHKSIPLEPRVTLSIGAIPSKPAL
ncbi:MAG: hypothetical protein CMA31_01115 [Euryarchaeota archaeon]|jgi:ribosomal protein L16 Arg81 hydroxylase|nr:hypothetical protein [Euryarchaeota archaeon]|tara:strand:+ start:91 stop:618 length:528 start_codon:yes stop_codon:yes gene_type:complete